MVPWIIVSDMCSIHLITCLNHDHIGSIKAYGYQERWISIVWASQSFSNPTGPQNPYLGGQICDMIRAQIYEAMWGPSKGHVSLYSTLYREMLLIRNVIILLGTAQEFVQDSFSLVVCIHSHRTRLREHRCWKTKGRDVRKEDKGREEAGRERLGRHKRRTEEAKREGLQRS